MYGDTRKHMADMFSGQTPIRRTNPKPGESEYYYFKPDQEGWSSLSEVETVDVPTKDTPNPYLQPQTNSFGRPIQLAQNNTQMNDENPKNFWNNVMNSSSQYGYDDIKQDYLGKRTFQNRYKIGCTPSNIAYNTISNYQISSNPKLIENGNITSNYAMNKFLSKIPIVGTYINGIANGQKIGNSVANIYNALDEANCFK